MSPTESVFLGECTGTDIVERNGPADLVVANNVLAHVPDLLDFIRGRRALVADRGTVSLEFPHPGASDRGPAVRHRSLFVRQLLTGGVIGPSFVFSAALTDNDIDRTVDVVAQACAVYRKALDACDPTPWMGG